ncbi:YeeE/YedE family protein [Pedobacter sp. SD-b]|uniref:YeeE/YedE family protein n=1 Tax=Pedobacter segetis TaxID=2793069 RepID=A0ABS1BNP8_9SPHI|nr:YeeE/YedE thiosulfate transporter family protein [Pedobacter segetis]MBK0383829.1 YeeE/YedE family protein [Pedobacter segetis]
MLEIIKQPWPWYVSGILIGLTVPALLLIGNKSFGVSSSLRHICAACLPSKIPFFSYNWKKEIWNLFFVAGILLGGFIAVQLLSNPEPIQIAASTKAQLAALGVKDFSGLMPMDLFGVDQILSLKGLIFMVIGGFAVGFGTRYAGGCTSGHAIMGLSNLQLPSLIATISFMVGGFVSTWVLLPIIFKLIA